MADFCWDCAPGMFGVEPAQNDLRDSTIPYGDMAFDICEGCGPGWFDRHGKKVFTAVRADGGWAVGEEVRSGTDGR